MALALLGAAAGGTASAQAPPSADAAARLASLMTARGLDAFAAPDQHAGRFLAVLLIPGVQLLVVSAESPEGPVLSAQIAQKQYRDVYGSLHQPVSAPTRFFVLDLGCDGLGGAGDGVDVLYEKGVSQTLVNGDWRSQKLSEAAYKAKVLEAERRYGEILGRLIDALSAAAPEG
jgi:hypothetical protein